MLGFLFGSMDREFEGGEALDRAAFDGDIETVRDILHRNRKTSTYQTYKTQMVLDIAGAPEKYKAPVALLEEITSSNFTYDDLFSPIENMGALETVVWSMHAKSPLPEVAKAAAMIMAEYMSYRIRHEGEAFSPQYLSMLRNAEGTDLIEAHKLAQAKGSIIATQNALVDLVEAAKEDKGMILQKGPKMLPFLQEIVSENVSNLWSRKLVDVNAVMAESVARGRLPVVKPRFDI